MKAIAIILIILVLAGGAFYLFQPSTPTTEYQQDEDVVATTTPNTIVASFTLAEVATHKDVKSCWVTINGNVYDLTNWISKHPGGEGAILSICGKDGTAAFTTQHEGQDRPEKTLASFFIGTLKK